jgi:hypothetical protein
LSTGNIGIGISKYPGALSVDGFLQLMLKLQQQQQPRELDDAG